MLQERQLVFQPFPPSHAKPKPQTENGRDEKIDSAFGPYHRSQFVSSTFIRGEV